MRSPWDTSSVTRIRVMPSASGGRVSLAGAAEAVAGGGGSGADCCPPICIQNTAEPATRAQIKVVWNLDMQGSPFSPRALGAAQVFGSEYPFFASVVQ